MAFKKMSSVKLPEYKQGYIYYYFRMYNILSEEDKNYIVELFKKCCGVYWKPVFEWLTTGKSIHLVSMDNYISERTLYRLKARVFENFKF